MAHGSGLAGRHIGLLTTWASRANGGVFEALLGHAHMLADAGATVTVFAGTSAEDARDDVRLARFGVMRLPRRGPAALSWVPGLGEALLRADLDLLHLHGIWQYPSAAAARWARRSGRPLVVSPHGMLDPWIVGRGRWKKVLARVGYERAAWSSARAFHALTAREAVDIVRETGRGEARVIANPAPDALSPSPMPAVAQVAYVGRIHPKKNLVALVDAWDRLARGVKLPTNARLVLAGWGEGADVTMLEARIAAAKGDISFVGPVFDAAKADLVAQSRFLVLPSLSEGLPMAVLEAWAAGRPTLMSEDCNLPEGFAAGAAVRCGHDAASIADGLQRLLSQDAEKWTGMRDAALGLAEGPFSRAAIARQWIAWYDGLIGGNAA